jgi:hypothetical protein
MTQTMALGMVRILGWLVIAHGLSHAVLPLRGSLAPAMLIGDWTPVALYGIGMVGFVAAGLGLLGLRPLDRAISPLLVLASGLSLVAIVRFADPSLWFGGACNVVLLLLGLWRGYGGWPAHPDHRRAWHVAGVALGFALLALVTITTFAFPLHRTWGSTPDELAMPLPGDPAVRHPALEIQHAVTIAAPPPVVWARLMQLEQNRAGSVGITYIEPERALVLENWRALVLRPAENGQTRFIIRSTISTPHIPVFRSAVNFMAFELPNFIMQRRMMLTIKALAEAADTRRAGLIR